MDGTENGTSTNITYVPCHSWLPDLVPNIQNATLEEVNTALIQRYIGGIILLSFIILVGLVGNIHVLLVYKHKYRPSNYRIYVMWLAMMDIFNCSVVAPLVIAYHIQSVTYFSSPYCKFFRYVLYVVNIASSSSLVVIGIDRHRRICSPLGEQFSSKQAKSFCGGSFLFACFLSWPAPVLFESSLTDTGVPKLDGVAKRCFTVKGLEKYQFLFNITLNGYFFIVTLILIILYAKIGRRIKSHYKFTNSIRRLSVRSEEELKKTTGAGARRSTYTLLAVTVAYICSALPHHVLVYPMFLIPGFDCSLSLPMSQLYYIFIWSYFLNSLLNPFIYGIKDTKFRFALMSLYKRQTKRGVWSMIAATHSSNGGSRRYTLTSDSASGITESQVN